MQTKIYAKANESKVIAAAIRLKDIFTINSSKVSIKLCGAFHISQITQLYPKTSGGLSANNLNTEY